MLRRWFLVPGLVVGLAAQVPVPEVRAAETPYDKTFMGVVRLCFPRKQTCSGDIPFHVFLSKSGRLYSFLRSEGGQVFPLGQFLQFGNYQERFVVNGTTLVFEHLGPGNDGAQVLLRGSLRAAGGSCSISASAMVDDVPEPTNVAAASCTVYQGQR
jgi:hypothetical protein